ncbi:MAG TPA: hypothetical protein VNL16_04235 [Chloroflexota bacterium]|nr:hypothetical protein [Chloroflexota bacterium]
MEPIDDEELARLKSLPWLSALDAGDAAQLIAEYEGALREAYRTGDRGPLEKVLDRWRERSTGTSSTAAPS